MGFSYHTTIGKLIYAIITCQPDISDATITLSQLLIKPAQNHYEAERQIFRYLAHTPDEGIYYWQEWPIPHLPNTPPLTLHPENYDIITDTSCQGTNLYRYSDSDCTSDSAQSKSITAIAIMYTGGAVGYKTKYQDAIAHNSMKQNFCGCL